MVPEEALNPGVSSKAMAESGLHAGTLVLMLGLHSGGDDAAAERCMITRLPLQVWAAAIWPLLDTKSQAAFRAASKVRSNDAAVSPRKGTPWGTPVLSGPVLSWGVAHV